MNDVIRDLRALKLDFVEPSIEEEPQKRSAPPPPPVGFTARDSRRLARVRVSLPAAVMVDQNLVIESATRDISEGGLLLSGYDGPDLKPGTHLNVALKGIISDDGSADPRDFFEMEVVRCEADRLALRFTG